MQPLSHRLIERVPIPPVIVGIVVALVGMVGFMIFAVQIGFYQKVVSGELPDIALRSYITLMIHLGYLPVAHLYLRRWTTQHHNTLTEHFQLDTPLRFPSGGQMRAAGILGWIAFYLMFLTQPNQASSFPPTPRLDAEFFFALLIVPATGWLLARLSYDLVHCARQVTALAQDIRQVDLLSLDPLKPFTQQGLRSALIMIIMISISANLIFDPDTALVGSVVNVTSGLLVAAVSLYLPLRGIHLRIHNRKMELLNSLRIKINAMQENLLSKRQLANHESQQLPSLLAIEERIARVSEWPFDAGSLGRISFYLLVGLGSWVGAALVEQLLETSF